MNNVKVKFIDTDEQWEKTYIVESDHFNQAKEKSESNGSFSIEFTDVEGTQVTQFLCLTKMEIIS